MECGLLVDEVRQRDALAPTPSEDGRPRRFSDFATLGDALDYAALGARGFNFHDPRGNLARAYPYRELRDDALATAFRLIAGGVSPGDRIALVAETGPEFAALFFGAIYAGAWPVPLPLPTSFGGRDSYVDQLGVQMRSADPKMLFHPPDLAEMARDAAASCGVAAIDWAAYADRPAPQVALPKAASSDIAYLQYSSGSTRFPHGVAVTHHALLNNLAAHAHGMDLQEGDRCVSWLPWYHDMGLVGCMLSLVANQVSGDYLKTEDLPAVRLPGSISSRAIPAPRSAIRRLSVTTSARAACPARRMSTNASTCRAGASRAMVPT